MVVGQNNTDHVQDERKRSSYAKGSWCQGNDKRSYTNLDERLV